MGLGWNVNTLLSIFALAGSIAVSIYIIRMNWKQYGGLFLLSGIVGVVLCYIFVFLRFYTFPFRLFPLFSEIPITLVLTFFPLYVLIGVRYSPQQWTWKIPFYWVLVHFGVTAEFLIEKTTDIIKYSPNWSIWDSYIWWWIYLLVFEWAGGLIVSPAYRKPLNPDLLRHGKIGWFITHFILMATIFLGGVYAGATLFK